MHLTRRAVIEPLLFLVAYIALGLWLGLWAIVGVSIVWVAWMFGRGWVANQHQTPPS